MKRFRTLQWTWGAFVAAVAVYAAMAYVVLQRSAGSALPTQPMSLVALLVAMAVGVFGVALYFHQSRWRPLCDEALKRVWAGRLADAANAQSVTTRLHGHAVVIMALCEAPAIFGLQLALMRAPAPLAIWGLMAATIAALFWFYWYGISAAADIFQHAERIAGP